MDCSSSTSEVSGSIVKIKLKNFLTYDSIVVKPGPNLNVIIGPNGSGKSSIVCAICLGLAGKPKVVGRAGNVSDYVKYGCDRAQLEIELYNAKGRNYIIGREITRENTSSWKLNGESTNQKSIEDLMSRLKIQVDNLCQFLPQDRVADFVKMTQQELLENTEKAVGEDNMHERHCQLKDLQKKLKNYNTTFENSSNRLESERQKNLRLEEEVKSFNEREVYEKKIQWLKKKLPWVEYEEHRQMFNQLKAQKYQLTKELKEIEKRVSPFTTKIAEINSNIESVEQKINQVNRTISQGSGTIAKILRDLESKKEEITEVEEEFKGKKAQDARRKMKIEEHKKLLDALYHELETLPEDADIQPEFEEINRQVKAATQDIVTIEREIDLTVKERDQITPEIRGKTQELNQLKDVHRRRMEMLKQKDDHAYKATLWLQKNKSNFKRTIYEPMMTLINVNEPGMATYVESHISFDDMCAFVCEDMDDMNNFLREVRDRQNLSVSAVHAPSKPSSHFQPQRSIDSYKQFGLISYIRELFTAPDPVVSYLCKQYNVHQTPVGDTRARDMIKEITTKTTFRNIYASTINYRISKSKYSGNILTTNTELRPPNMLRSSFNAEKIHHLEKDLEKLQNALPTINQSLKEKETRKDEIIAQINMLKTQKNELIRKRDSRKTLKVKISQKEQSIANLEAEFIDLNAEESKMKTAIEKIVNKKLAVLRDLTAAHQNVVELSIKKLKLIAQVAVEVEKKYKAEDESRKLTTELEAKRLDVLNFEGNLIETRNTAKDLISKARRECGLPPDSPLTAELKDVFAGLPSAIHEINAAIYENQARADVLLQTNPEVITEYNRRKKEIEALEQNTEQQKENVDRLKHEMEEVKQLWLPGLEILMQKIDLNFGRFFKSLGCVGEVALKKGGSNEDEFDKYAISLKVKYRDSEQLRELSAHEHSGGERSVATILFVMALQELTRVPFRCVDEINQGMDSTNERKVFELLVEISCRENTAQYFLLTPKLLPDLQFNANMTIHTIFNGENSLDHTQWDLKKFIKRRQELPDDN